MNFNLNDKIVCVDDALPYDAFEYPGGYVKQGQVYCVAGIGPKGGVLVLGHPAFFWGFDFGWCGFRFRKVNRTEPQVSGLSVEINGIIYPVKSIQSNPDAFKMGNLNEF